MQNAIVSSTPPSTDSSRASGDRDGHAFLTVANSGPVIAEPEAGALFALLPKVPAGGPDAHEADLAAGE